MKLVQFIADAKQVVVISLAVLGTAIGEHVFHGTWPSTAVVILGLVGAGLAAWKIDPPASVAQRAVTRSNSTYPKG